MDQTYSVHKRTNRSILLLLHPINQTYSVHHERTKQTYSHYFLVNQTRHEMTRFISTIPSSDETLVQCRVTSPPPPRLPCTSTHLYMYTGEGRGHLRVKGLSREPIIYSTSLRSVLGNIGQSCSFVLHVYVSLFNCWPVCHIILVTVYDPD